MGKAIRTERWEHNGTEDGRRFLDVTYYRSGWSFFNLRRLQRKTVHATHYGMGLKLVSLPREIDWRVKDEVISAKLKHKANKQEKHEGSMFEGADYWMREWEAGNFQLVWSSEIKEALA